MSSLRQIKQVDYNWRVNEAGREVYECARVGHAGVIRITEHRAAGEGDRWYYDIHKDDGEMFRIFNPNMVHFLSDEDQYSF